jgi:hypothetical protein
MIPETGSNARALNRQALMGLEEVGEIAGNEEGIALGKRCSILLSYRA